VLSGGVFTAGETVRRPLVRALLARGCAALLVSARFPPEVGAALLAARAAGLDVAAMIRRLAVHQTGGRE